MLIAQPVFRGSALGAVVDDVKSLQTALARVSASAQDGGFNPGPIDGTVRAELVFALVYTVNKLSRTVPGVSDLVGLINKIPQAGSFLSGFVNLVGSNRGVMAITWAFLGDDVRKSVTDFVRSNAGLFAKAMAAAASFLSRGGGTYPAGTVAVRDSSGKFRLLARI